MSTPEPSSAPSTTPPATPAVDTRIEPPLLSGDRESLDGWLDFYRETLLRKIDGLDAEQLCRRSVPPSDLSPIGLVRHLTDVEAYWLREVLLDEAQPDPHCDDDNPHGDLDDVDPATALDDIEAYRREIEATRAAQASWSDLDGPVRGLVNGKQANLRWLISHLIEEYARHLGHLDLLREAIDGGTGY